MPSNRTLLLGVWLCLLGTSSALSRRDALKELRLETKFTAQELRKAYRQRSLQTHPDKEGGSERAFLRVAEAYELLTDDSGGSKKRFGNGGGGQAAEDAMRAAEEMLSDVMEQFATMDGTSAHKLVDAVIGEPAGIMGWFMKKALTAAASSLMPAIVDALESDSMTVNVDGQQYKGSDFKQWRRDAKERKAKK